MRRMPELSAAGATIQPIFQPVTEKVVGANFAKKPVYYVGVIPEKSPAGYGELRAGFARKFILETDAGDPFAFVRADLDRLTAYRFPTRPYPASSWRSSGVRKRAPSWRPGSQATIARYCRKTVR